MVDAAGGGPNQLTIYDVTGRQVAMVAKGLQGRVVDVTWNGRDERGMLVASGVYFARLTGVGESTRTEKFVIVR